MIEARTLWELVEQRADGDPRRAHGRRRGRPHAHVRRVPRRGRASRGRVSPRSASATGDVVSWQLPTWIESIVLVGRAVAARRGAEPDPADLPRARGRLRHQAGRRASCSSCRGRGAASTTRRWRRRSRASQPGLEVLVANRALPAGRSAPRCRRRRSAPDRPAPTCRCAGSSTRRARRPTRRARGTPTPRSRPARSAWASGLEVDRRRPHRRACSRSPTSAASSGSSARLRVGCTMIVRRGVRPRDDDPGARAARASRSPARARRSTWRTSPHQRSRSRSAPLFPQARAFIGGGAPKPPQLHYDVKAELGGVGDRLGLRAHRGADPHDGVGPRHRREARQHRGPRRSPASS